MDINPALDNIVYCALCIVHEHLFIYFIFYCTGTHILHFTGNSYEGKESVEVIYDTQFQTKKRNLKTYERISVS